MKRNPIHCRTRLLLTSLLLLPTLGAAGVDIAEPYTPPSSEPSPLHFEVCYQHTCKEVAEVSFTDAEWREIQGFFEPAPASAAEERERIALAVSRMEVMVGQKINTFDDKGGNLQGWMADSYQMDCVDESTNTTTYLTMMLREGLLKWHRVEDRKTRGFLFFGGWPHTTAVIKEKETAKEWVVDSWFYDNGVPPVIMPLQEWYKGWKPPGFKG